MRPARLWRRSPALSLWISVARRSFVAMIV
jgi:hypothetical protein